jgi:hypothetical protein
MKQKKLIESNEENEELNNGSEETEKPDQEFDSHFFGDSFQDYRSFKTSIDYDQEEGVRHLTLLNERIYEVYHASRWSALGPNKKVPKDLIPFIFQEMFEQLEASEFSMVEKFVTICDFMNINYAKAYELIHMKYKESIVIEMDKKFGIVSKKKIKKIF